MYRLYRLYNNKYTVEKAFFASPVLPSNRGGNYFLDDLLCSLASANLELLRSFTDVELSDSFTKDVWFQFYPVAVNPYGVVNVRRALGILSERHY